MKLLHFTDIHLTRPGDTIRDRDPNANFAAALAHAMALHSDADALFITGDLSDWGDAEDYTRLREMIAPLPMPVHLMIGNHDDRAAFLNAFPELQGAGGFVHYRAPLPLGTALCLDTWEPQTHAGHFCAARAAWLAEQLEACEGPVWLFMHHNPVPLRVAPMDEIMLLDANRFAQTVQPFASRIRHIFHGHCHLPLSGSLHGIPFSAPRGTNHAAFPDFSATTFLTSAPLPEAYAVVFADAASVMTHMVEFTYSGDTRAEATPDYASWDRQTMAR
ncbi:MAG: metallophosphoesterase [Pseudomonadota bacterium]